MKRNWKSYLKGITLILLAALVAVPVMAEEEEAPTADFSVAVLSHYIWRGQELSHDSAVIEPSATVGYKGFSVNIWGNLDTDPYTGPGGPDIGSMWNETDLTLDYSRAVGPVTLSGGYIYYGLEGIDDTQEIYLSIAGDVITAPTLTIYRDIGHYSSWYFLFGLSHTFELNEYVGLELGATASYLLSDSDDDYPEIDDQGNPTTEEFSAFHDGTLSVGLPISFAKYFSVTPAVSYIFPLSDEASDEMKWRSFKGDDDNFMVYGLTCSFAF